MKRVVIVDDDVAFRQGLEVVLGDYFQEIVAVSNHSRVLSCILSFAPDAILIDPSGPGLDLARQVRSHLPHVRIVFLALFDRYLDAALKVGADGYFLKGCPIDELIAALYRSERLT